MTTTPKFQKSFGHTLFAMVASAFAVSAVAGPVVVTPGSSAGYLYFPPAAVSSGSGSGSDLHPVLGDCEKIDTIGGTCRWGDGLQMKLGGKAGTTKYLYAVVETARSSSCNVQAYGSGVDNTERLTACSQPAAYCKSKGIGFFLPSQGELATVYANRAALGLPTTLVSSTTSANWGDYNQLAVAYMYNGTWQYYPTSSAAFICLRTV